MSKSREEKDKKEIRAIPIKLEIRSSGEDGKERTISGAIKYNTDSAEMRDYWGDKIVEQISDGAFTDSLKVRNVVGLWSHDTSKILGNTKSGTLRVYNESDELRFDLDIPATSDGNDAWTLIQRGDVDGLSFGMSNIKDKWSSENRADGKVYKRTILSADLFEISPVAFPAYPSNEVSARSLEDFKDSEKGQHKKLKMKLSKEN